MRGCVAAAVGLLVCFAAVASAAARPAIGAGEHLVVRPTVASLPLYASPGGPVVASVGRWTMFGQPLVLSVVARRGDWLGVTAEALPDNRIGWVDARSGVAVSNTAFEIRVSLSTHVAELLDHGRAVRTVPVAIGAGDSPTPTGRFAVAEKLSGAVLGSGYGCCLLGLTARQLHPPPGWSTARPWFVAIHGGGGIGAAVSAGCLHASEADLRYLLRTVPLGTPVVIRS